MTNLLFRLCQQLLECDAESVAAAFPGPVALNTPLTGAIDGRHALETWFGTGPLVARACRIDALRCRHPRTTG